MRYTYLSLTANAVIHVAPLSVLKGQENVGVSVNNLVKAHDMWMLQLLHCLDFSLHFLLHAQLANLVLV